MDPISAAYPDQVGAFWGQVYFYGANVPQLLNGTIWGGRKYSDRLQTGINDQMVENDDGDGFGIDDMNLGFGKFSIGYNQDPNIPGDPANPDSLNKGYSAYGRITGIQTFQNAALSVYAGYYGYSKNKNSAVTAPDAGYRVGLYHSADLGKWGSNFLGFKYAKNDGGGADGHGAGENRWQVILQHGFNLASARTGIDFLAEYRDKKIDNVSDHDKWLAVGARTDTNISGPFRFLLEAGYDRDQIGSQSATTLLKITGALAVSAGKDPWSRPTFRLYYTYGSWSDVGVLDGYSAQNTQTAFGTSKSGGSFGVQAEGWW